MNPPVATDTEMLALREFHPFEARGARYLYMVPSAGIFRMDGPSNAILDTLANGPVSKGELVGALSEDHGIDRVLETIDELIRNDSLRHAVDLRRHHDI